MNCPSCNTPLEQNARFCGVCGYRLQAPKAAPAAGQVPTIMGDPPKTSVPPVMPTGPSGSAGTKSPAGPNGGLSGPAQARAQAQAQKPKPAPKPKPKQKQGDEIYVDTVLNNRFKVESKIGEGGFGAVYRGVQLATGRKVALKLLHPEMTKDENLVARFRREGMVLCNLRDAHTITTYDFDQTPDGTLYIAMELLEGKSLHQIFHEQAPLEWKRVFKILTEMCSSLAEAHAQGIVHRDLKPENIYLESRPGNPEFVKILDFGIAKVMRGDTIDPQSPQLTATGQTLGTLEYMSPEQLMGKALDGRSDVYALGVVAYEMITGKLPFPDAKGPAGLITAQLKTTPPPPSTANPKAGLPAAVDRVILKCLEKDKNNRYADVTALSAALSEVMSSTSQNLEALPASASQSRAPGAELLETRRGDLPMMAPPAMPGQGAGHVQGQTPPGGSPLGQTGPNQQSPFAAQSSPSIQPLGSATPQPYPAYNAGAFAPSVPPGVHQGPGPMMPSVLPGMSSPAMTPYPQASASQIATHGGAARPMAPTSSNRWIWWVVGLLALGATAGAVLALVMRN